MLKQLMEIVQANADEAIVKNPSIPNSKNKAAMKATAGSILNNLKKTAGGGQLDTIKELFQGKTEAASSPVINQLSGNVTSDLMKKFGINQNAASGIVQQILPVVMKQLINRTNDPNDKSINLEGILGTLTKGGGKGGLLGGLLKGLFKG